MLTVAEQLQMTIDRGVNIIMVIKERDLPESTNPFLSVAVFLQAGKQKL